MASNNKYLESIVEMVRPGMQQQQQGMYNYLSQLGMRQGIPAAMRQASQAVAPYAHELGQASAAAAGKAAQMKQAQEQYDATMEWQKEQARLAQENWQKNYALTQQQIEANQRQTELNNLMSMIQYTGWTPEITEALGYSSLTGREKADFYNLMQNRGFINPQTQGAGGTSGGFGGYSSAQLGYGGSVDPRIPTGGQMGFRNPSQSQYFFNASRTPGTTGWSGQSGGAVNYFGGSRQPEDPFRRVSAGQAGPGLRPFG